MSKRIPKVGDMIRCPMWAGGADYDLDDIHNDNFYPIVRVDKDRGEFHLEVRYKTGKTNTCSYNLRPFGDWEWEYLDLVEEPEIPDYLERIGERDDDI